MNLTKNKLLKPCKICGSFFKPYKTTNKFCSWPCLNTDAQAKEKEKAEKEKDQEKKASEYVQALQYYFNLYVRIRDRGKNCISCSKNLGQNTSKYDAGHRFKISLYPELRFNELNAWGQCIECNQYNDGAPDEYDQELIKRIGLLEYEKLTLLKNVPKKYTVYELKALILKYKQKIKQIDI